MKSPLHALTPEFMAQIGIFQVAWSAAELTIDMALRDFLRLSSEEAHILTAGLEFNRKATILRRIVKRSDHPKRSEIVGAINTMQNESKRNVFAHGYVAVNDHRVNFIDRGRGGGGPLKATEHPFNLEEFKAHVRRFSDASVAVSGALGFSDKDCTDFVSAALSLSDKE